MNRRIVSAVVAIIVVAGCTPAPTVIKPEPVEVPRYLHVPLPAELVAACTFTEPDAACWREGKREFCNGQLTQMLNGYRLALWLCSADKSALRALDDRNDK